MKIYLIAFSFLGFICLGSSCSALLSYFRVVKTDGSRVEYVADDNNLAHLYIDAIDFHHYGGNMLTVFMKIRNNSKDTIFFQGLPFELRTEQFDVTLIQEAKDSGLAFIAPGDSLKSFWDFRNAFRGSFKKFLTYLSKGKIYIHPKNIKQHNKELIFPECELVFKKPEEGDI